MGFLDKLGFGGNKSPEGGVAPGFDANGNKIESGAGSANEVQPNQSPDFLTNATQGAPTGTEAQPTAMSGAGLEQAHQVALDTANQAAQVATENAPSAPASPTPAAPETGVDTVAEQVSEQLGATGESVKMPEVSEIVPGNDDQGSAAESAPDETKPAA